LSLNTVGCGVLPELDEEDEEEDEDVDEEEEEDEDDDDDDEDELLLLLLLLLLDEDDDASGDPLLLLALLALDDAELAASLPPSGVVTSSVASRSATPLSAVHAHNAVPERTVEIALRSAATEHHCHAPRTPRKARARG
jgi:hypothetical protein